jgi:hypothetical protein
VEASELERLGGLFRALAEIDFRGSSPLYERLALDASGDDEVLSLLSPAATTDRLPHLLFGAVSYLLAAQGSGPLEAFDTRPFPQFRSWCLAHRAELEDVVATHVVQTNEVGRSAALMPCLAVVGQLARQPLAIIEVGASAGLNLLFDRYRYVYAEGDVVGPAEAEVVVRPHIEGSQVPEVAMPEVAWRRGLDRRPLDVTDDEAVRWLRACIWPEQEARRELLARAVVMARRDPPTLVAGDAVESLPALVRAAPGDAALCIVHTAVLPYLPDYRRFMALLTELADERPLWWVPGEAEGLIPQLQAPSTGPGLLAFLFGLVPLGLPDHQPRVLARTGSHGTWLEWLSPEFGRSI